MTDASDQYWVYILMNRGETVLYIGVTSALRRRVGEHRRREVEGFTKRYNCTKLVHAEPYPRPQDAIEREKQLKNWNRDWKLVHYLDERDQGELYDLAADPGETINLWNEPTMQEQKNRLLRRLLEWRMDGGFRSCP